MLPLCLPAWPFHSSCFQSLTRLGAATSWSRKAPVEIIRFFISSKWFMLHYRTNKRESKVLESQTPPSFLTLKVTINPGLPNCCPTPGPAPAGSKGWIKPLEVWFVLTVCTRSCQFYANIFMLFLFQFMLKEFEARRHQHEQLNQAAQSILTGPGDVSPSTSQVQDELQGVNQKWSELTERLNSRSSQIDQAIVKSTQYQELLQGLSEKVKAVGQRLSSQSAISTQPDAVKQQLEETSEIRSDLEQLEEEISEAQTLCDDLSVLIGEQYLKDELRKRLETVALPLKGLEDLAGERGGVVKRCWDVKLQPCSLPKGSAISGFVKIMG